MSQENVDRLIVATRAFNRIATNVDEFDRDALEAWLGFLDPQITFEPQQAALEGTYVGRDGAMEWLADLANHYDNGAEIVYTEVRDLGDRVLGLGSIRLKGKASGIEAEVPAALLVTFRDGLMIHLRDYGDHQHALRDNQLPE